MMGELDEGAVEMTRRIKRAGFPDFWARAFAEKPDAFEATSPLIDLENKIFERPLE